MKDLVSVIVPVYNVDQYLNVCIKSIVQQTYKNIEILLIDDGSTDNCAEMCDTWEKSDSRIRVFHQENRGLSRARNRGLEKAKGSFVIFIDSDDYISNEMIEILVNQQKINDADIVECDILRVEEDENIKFKKEGSFRVESFSNLQAMKLLIEDTIIHQTVWNKLYRREVIQDIIFPEGKCNEDEFWTYRVIGNCHKLDHVFCNLYFYRKRNGSIINVFNLKRLDALEAKVERKKYLENNFPQLIDIAEFNLLISCIYAGQMIIKYVDMDQQLHAWKLLYKTKATLCYERIWRYETSWKQKIWIIMSWFSLHMTCVIRNYLKIGF